MISILLFEDLAIVPLLILVAFLAPGREEATMADRMVSVVIRLTALVLAGRYLLDPVFRLLARFGVREIMTAAALLVVLGAAVLMDAAGLSMAMGAFLAGCCSRNPRSATSSRPTSSRSAGFCSGSSSLASAWRSISM